jgi:hypothetical protein
MAGNHTQPVAEKGALLGGKLRLERCSRIYARRARGADASHASMSTSARSDMN